MKLYCVRHGEALNAEVDPERPLSESGTAGVLRVAQYMSEQDIHIDALMHSPKLRTTQTADIFAKCLGATQSNTALDLLGELCDPKPIIEMIPAWEGDTMLVGHLPFLSALISALVLGDQQAPSVINYAPGTVVCLDRCNNASRWVISWLLGPDRVPDH